MKLSIVMLTKNSERELPRVLSALRESLEAWNHELIIVDGQSRDRTLAMVKQHFPDVRVFLDGGNLCRAREVGVRNAKGDYVFFIDSDICVTKDFFSKMLKDFDLDRMMGCVVAKFMPFPEYDESLIARYYRSLKPHVRGDISGFQEYGATACTGFKAEAIQKCVFDHRFQKAAEDKHITRQVTELGYRLFFDASIYCEHIRPSTVWEEVKRYFQHGYYAPLYAKLHNDASFKRQMIGVMLYLISIALPLLIPLYWIARLRAHEEKHIVHGMLGYLLLLSRRLGTLTGYMKWLL